MIFILITLSSYQINKKIRVGYFSGDFKFHAVFQLIQDLFLNHDKSKFEIYAYSTFKTEGLPREKIIKNVDKFYDIDHLADDEIINLIASHSLDVAIDLSGYTISDAAQVRHTFSAGSVIPANGVLVVFGGGTPTGSFGGATIQTASTGSLNMSNAGDLMTLRDAGGTIVLTFDINPLSGNPNESYTRNPDLTGDFEQHAGVTAANGALFSPGTKLDGTSF